jgi:DNA-binding transcriptional LysR family regulator
MGAARSLGAQQPTLSRHIAELEAQLGAALFERTGRGVVPTAAALAIAEAAREMQAGAERLAAGLDRQRQSTTGTVRLAASQIAASHLLPPVQAALREAEPGIQVELVVSNAISNLLRREADIAVRMARPDQASLVARKLADLPIVACAHERYLARHGMPQAPAELLDAARGHTLIGYERDDTILRGFAAMGFGVEHGHFMLRTDDQLAYGELIAAGAGIGFSARYCLRSWPGVVPILPGLPIPPIPCWLAVHREIRGNAVVRRVFDFLGAMIPEVLGGDEPATAGVTRTNE